MLYWTMDIECIISGPKIEKCAICNHVLTDSENATRVAIMAVNGKTKYVMVRKNILGNHFKLKIAGYLIWKRCALTYQMAWLQFLCTCLLNFVINKYYSLANISIINSYHITHISVMVLTMVFNAYQFTLGFGEIIPALKCTAFWARKPRHNRENPTTLWWYIHVHLHVAVLNTPPPPP